MTHRSYSPIDCESVDGLIVRNGGDLGELSKNNPQCWRWQHQEHDYRDVPCPSAITIECYCVSLVYRLSTRSIEVRDVGGVLERRGISRHTRPPFHDTSTISRHIDISRRTCEGLRSLDFHYPPLPEVIRTSSPFSDLDRHFAPNSHSPLGVLRHSNSPLRLIYSKCIVDSAFTL